MTPAPRGAGADALMVAKRRYRPTLVMCSTLCSTSNTTTSSGTAATCPRDGGDGRCESAVLSRQGNSSSPGRKRRLIRPAWEQSRIRAIHGMRCSRPHIEKHGSLRKSAASSWENGAPTRVLDALTLHVSGQKAADGAPCTQITALTAVCPRALNLKQRLELVLAPTWGEAV